MTNPPAEEPPTASGLRWFGLSDKGKIRKNNEDAFIGLRFDAQEFHLLGKYGEASLSHTDFAFAVSDGIGGNRAGEFASRVAVEKITRILPRSYKQAALGLQSGFEDVMEEIFDQIHKSLNFLSNYEETEGMGATLSLCWFTPQWMYFGHIGDTRVYYFPAEGGMKQLTQDDTHVGWLRHHGKLSEYQARTHPRRNILQKALGAGHQFVNPQVGAVGFNQGDRFLLCTDGIIDGLYDSQVLDYMRPTQGWATEGNPVQALVQAALANSGRDNTTALIVEVI
jgi:PPM family protein phosphatase